MPGQTAFNIQQFQKIIQKTDRLNFKHQPLSIMKTAGLIIKSAKRFGKISAAALKRILIGTIEYKNRAHAFLSDIKRAKQIFL